MPAARSQPKTQGRASRQIRCCNLVTGQAGRFGFAACRDSCRAGLARHARSGAWNASRARGREGRPAPSLLMRACLRASSLGARVRIRSRARGVLAHSSRRRPPASLAFLHGRDPHAPWRGLAHPRVLSGFSLGTHRAPERGPPQARPWHTPRRREGCLTHVNAHSFDTPVSCARGPPCPR